MTEAILENVQEPPPTEEILGEVEGFIRRFVVLEDFQIVALSLWTLHTWAIEAAHTTPYLFACSPEEETGKTRLLETLQQMVPTPIAATDISESGLFRVIDSLKPTLFLDEVDAIFSRASKRDGSKDTFRSLLNAGYRRGGKAYRVSGNNGSQTLDSFDVFGPKALAGIGTLPRTLGSRCLTISMKRRHQNEEIEDFYPEDLNEETRRMRARLEAWAGANVQDLRSSRPEKIPGLRDRVNEVWRPLLAIATTGGEDWNTQARNAAVKLAAVASDASWGIQLLTDIRTILVDKDIERISTIEMLDFLRGVEESPWSEEFDGKGSPRKLARLLKPYGITPGSVRLEDGSTPKGYRREDFQDAWERLLPAPTPGKSATSATSATPQSQSQASVADVADVADIPPSVGWDG